MFNAICFADLHIDNYSKHSVNRSRLNNCLNVLDFVFKTAHERGVKTVVFCGDLFDKPTNISVIAFNATVLRFKKLFEQYPAITFVAVAGNHDYSTYPVLDKSAETSVDIFPELFDRFILLDHTTPPLKIDDCYIYGVEFFYHAEEYYQAVDNIKVIEDTTNILLTHATFTDIDPKVTGYIDPYFKGFLKFSFRLSGDIHRKKDFGGTLMLGSSLHKDMNDVGDSKGIWHIQVMKDEVIKQEFITTDSLFPLFHKVEVGVDISNIPKKDYIEYIPKQLTSANIEGCDKVMESIDSFESSEKDNQMLSDYLETSNLNDKENLLKVGSNYLARV